MTLYLYNASTEPIIVEQFGTRSMIQPTITKEIHFEGQEICIKLFHTVSDRLNVGWYLAESIFSLSQMRTVLVVDGEYVFRPEFDGATIKVKSQEYVFEKHTSYQTFVFAPTDCCIERGKLQVADGDRIYKKAKFLYLFGGSKSFLISCGILLFVLLLIAIDFPNSSIWDWIEVGIWLSCFLILFVRYKKALKFLKESMQEKAILAYLALPRREFRRTSDDIIQKNFENSEDNEQYQ